MFKWIGFIAENAWRFITMQRLIARSYCYGCHALVIEPCERHSILKYATHR